MNSYDYEDAGADALLLFLQEGVSAPTPRQLAARAARQRRVQAGRLARERGAWCDLASIEHAEDMPAFRPLNHYEDARREHAREYEKVRAPRPDRAKERRKQRRGPWRRTLVEQRRAARRYRAANLEEVLRQQRERWRKDEEARERALAKKREYKAANRKSIRAADRAYRARKRAERVASLDS